jgi:hypothetical protein
VVAGRFFAACLSDDCPWVGFASEVNDPILSSGTLRSGFSTVTEKLTMDPLHMEMYRQLSAGGATSMDGVKIPNMTPSEIIASDRSGYARLYSPSNYYDKSREALIQGIGFKIFLMDTSNIFFINKPENPSTQKGPLDKDLIKNLWYEVEEDGKEVKVNQYGFPPVKILYDFAAPSMSWSFWATSDNVWHPLDWGAMDLSKDTCVHYLAVLQDAAQNFTYFCNEDLETGSFRAGVSVRRVMATGPGKVISSSASTCEEAKEKLSRHYKKSANEVTEKADVLEQDWEKEFGYGDTVMSVVSSVLDSGIYKDDVLNVGIRMCTGMSPLGAFMALKDNKPLGEI